MVTEDCLNRVLPVVADSWAQLRRSDVDRLLNQIRYENKASLLVAAGIVAAKRPDLQKQIDQAVEWISEERGMDEAVGAPSTRDYVVEHINALGPQQESSLVAWMLLKDDNDHDSRKAGVEGYDDDNDEQEVCPKCGHSETSDGYGGNDCPDCWGERGEKVVMQVKQAASIIQARHDDAVEDSAEIIERGDADNWCGGEED